MSEPKDPEQLLADALRAQAVFAPQVSPAAPSAAPSQSSPSSPPEPGTDAVPTSAINELPSAYGLLSGASADALERERAALDPVAEAPTAYTPRPPEPPRQGAQLPAYWILLLAVLLGL